MPFIELNAKQRRALLNELIDEATNEELVSMARLLITRASFNLPRPDKDRILKHVNSALKVETARKSVGRIPPFANEEEDEE